MLSAAISKHRVLTSIISSAELKQMLVKLIKLVSVFRCKARGRFPLDFLFVDDDSLDLPILIVYEIATG